MINSTDGTVENSSIAVKLQSVITGIADNKTTEINAYPNLTNGIVTIANGAAMDITVFDLAGNQVMATEKNTTQIDLSNLSNGVYFLKFNNQQEAFTKKFVLFK